MLERFLRALAGGVEQNSAKLERRVVSDPKLPVGGNIARRVRQIAFHDGQQILDFLRAGLVRRYWPIASSSRSVPFTNIFGESSTEVTK